MYISIYHNKLNVSNAHMADNETALYIDGLRYVYINGHDSVVYVLHLS